MAKEPPRDDDPKSRDPERFRDGAEEFDRVLANGKPF
jgi:hypothetical protein